MATLGGRSGFWTISLVSAWCATTMFTVSAARATPPPSVSGHYFVSGQMINVNILRDRIGVAANQGVPDSALFAALDSLHMTVLTSDGAGSYIVALNGTVPTRAAIVAKARNLRLRRPDLVRNAGFVITLPGFDTPTIVTDNFIARFNSSASDSAIAAWNAHNHVSVVRPLIGPTKEYVLSVPIDSNVDAMEMANRYVANSLVTFSNPDFIPMLQVRSDPLLANQWHLENNANGNGVKDADVDAAEAWALTKGSGIVVATIGGGVDLVHEDLVGRFWKNPNSAEIVNGRDDDGDGCIDDIDYGCNFYTCVASDNVKCTREPSVLWVKGPDDIWRVPLDLDREGTPVAGLIAATADNSTGGAGVCPECTLMIIRIPSDKSFAKEAFEYAWKAGADVIECSWGYMSGTAPSDELKEAITDAADHGRGEKGCTIAFSMTDDNTDNCVSNDISSLPDVIGVSASTNEDKKAEGTGIGACGDLLAPSSGGTQWIVSTDVHGPDGYNDAKNGTSSDVGTCPSPDPSIPPDIAANMNYLYCFTGTSAAAPIVAGSAALVLAASPDLTRQQVQDVLQDTADKIEPSQAQYDTDSGFSRGISGTPTHGFGRVNAFEAVRVVSTSAGGRGGVDLYLRDNMYDWGNTEQPSNTLFEGAGTPPSRGFIAHWNSEDVKIDPNSGSTPMTLDSKAFDQLPNRNPVAGQNNVVYVRVRNRGPKPATKVTARLYWAYMGAAVPALPSDFWTGFSTNSFTQTDWHFLSEWAGSVNADRGLDYGGCTAVRVARDDPAKPSEDAAIIPFPWTPPTPSADQPNHYCLLVIVDSAEDHPGPYAKILAMGTLSSADFDIDELTPSDNNISHHNYVIESTETTETFSERFYLRNIGATADSFMVQIQKPKDWVVTVQGVERIDTRFRLKAKSKALVTMTVKTSVPRARGEITVMQERIRSRKVGKETVTGRENVGGVTFAFAPTR